ncbi:MAG: DUF2339 domain-containing protein [Roseibium sp.]|uniref:DUF2339 domain-containing protein n=1 Tax=Roseibium sp. TaxID=1936156 RepID=UPI003296BFA0
MAGSWRAHGWALAALGAPAMTVILEIFRAPSEELGMTWSVAIMAIAAAATVLAERAARHDGEDRFRVSIAALAAMSMIALGLFVSFSDGALSLALAVLVLAAVALDDRFNLPSMSPFVQIGVAVLIYRAVTYPNMGMLIDGPFWEFAFGFFPAIALLAAAWLLSHKSKRVLMHTVIEGGLLVITGIMITIAITRMSVSMMDGLQNAHWLLGLVASTWLVIAGASLRNVGVARRSIAREDRSRLRYIVPQVARYTSAGFALLLAFGLILVGLTIANPLFGGISGSRVTGTILLNTLLMSYLLPALILGFGALRVPGLHRILRYAGLAVAGLLGLHWAILTVAHAWRGPDLPAVPMGAGELWTYTAMLLLIGTVLMVGSLWKGSKPMRMVANGFLVLAIGKVFLVDAPDLDGLIRAGSFLILGLCLAGLAWVNRLAMVSTPTGGE